MSSRAQEQVRVLLIEDDQVLIEQTQLYLSDFGYQVEIASQPEHALTLIHEFQPEVVLCALKLEAGCGIELIGRIKDTHRSLPVIVTAEESQMGGILSALRHGAFDYIAKPFLDQSALLYALQAAAANDDDEVSTRDELEIAISELRYNREALTQDEKVASLFQASLLPDQHVNAGGIEISWRMPLRSKASRYFLDVFTLSDQYTSFYIADFGENPADAAFSSGVLKVVFNEAIRELSRDGSPLLLNPAGVMGRAGYYLKSLSLKQSPSLVYGLLDVQEGKMKWASADFEKGPYIWLQSATQLLAETGPKLTQSEAKDYECNEFMVEASMPLVFTHMAGEQVRLIAESTSNSQWPVVEQDLLCQPAKSHQSCSDVFSFVVKRKS